MQNSNGSDGDLCTLCCVLIECDGRNGSNHWILCQPDQVSRTDTMARETNVLFAATSDCLLSQRCGNLIVLTDLDIICTMLHITFGTHCHVRSNLTMYVVEVVGGCK